EEIPLTHTTPEVETTEAKPEIASIPAENLNGHNPKVEPDEEKRLLPYLLAPLSDQGNAENTLRVGSKFRYVPEQDDFAIWQSRWTMSAENQIKQLILQAARNRRDAAELIHIADSDDEKSKRKLAHKKEQLRWALQSENQSKINATLAALSSMPSLS